MHRAAAEFSWYPLHWSGAGVGGGVAQAGAGGVIVKLYVLELHMQQPHCSTAALQLCSTADCPTCVRSAGEPEPSLNRPASLFSN